MFMKAGEPFTGRGGTEYTTDAQIEQCDIGLACRFGWQPVDAETEQAADALAEAVAKAIPADPPAKGKKSA